MQIAKKIFMLCYMLVSTVCLGQSPEGTYEWTGSAGLSVSHIDLKDNQTFEQTDQGDFGGAKYFGGYYMVRDDTLLLFHTELSHPDSSYYKITHRQDSSSAFGGMTKKYLPDLAILSLTITGPDNEPLPGANVTILRQEKTLSLLTTDTLGKVYVRTEGEIADQLNVFYRFHKNLKIDLSDFWGHATELKVRLSDNPDIYNQEEFVEKYLIAKTAEGTVLHLVGSFKKFEKLPPDAPRARPNARTG